MKTKLPFLAWFWLVALSVSAVCAQSDEPTPPPVPPAEARPAAPPEAEAEPTPEAEPAPEAGPVVERDAGEEFRRGFLDGFQSGAAGSDEIVRIGADVLVEAGVKTKSAVAVLGNVVADGEIDGEAVAVLGDVTINGEADGDLVAVMGSVTINGEVDGNVVAVMGNVQLGPDARLDGDVVVVGGQLIRAPGSKHDGDLQQVPFLGGRVPDFTGLRAWVRECLLLGRPLALHPDVGWAWGVTGVFFGIYLLLALLFGRSMVKCSEVMEERPGYTILSAVLVFLLTPVVFVLLAFTGIGPLLFLPLLFLAALYGKAAFLVWLGRRVLMPLGLSLPVVAALVGSVILLALYVVPLLGFFVQLLSVHLGLGMVVLAVIQAGRRESPAGVAPAGAATGAAGSAGAAVPGTDASAASVPPPVPAVVVPPPVELPLASMARAGFWLRTGALALDAILVGFVTNLLDLAAFPVWFALYAVVLWALRGTTVGGAVFGLKVVRLDDRKVDWAVALVRGLGGFLSLAALGLGFFWIAFDRERQAWHDKIAGTVVVRVPKGVALI